MLCATISARAVPCAAPKYTTLVAVCVSAGDERNCAETPASQAQQVSNRHFHRARSGTISPRGGSAGEDRPARRLAGGGLDGVLALMDG